MQKDETKCFLCGTMVATDKEKVTLRKRFSTIVTISMVLSSAMTIASLFTDYTPSFTKCFSASVMLALVKKSAMQMNANV